MARPLPKRWLIHSIAYEAFKGIDSWDNPIYDKPITIDNVRFDDSTVFSRDSTQSKIVAEAVVFIDAKHSTPKVDFKEQSKITFNGKDYILKKVIPCYHPTKNKIRHFELEVI